MNIQINSVFFSKERKAITKINEVELNYKEHNFLSTVKYYLIFLWHLISYFFTNEQQKSEVAIYRDWSKKTSSVHIRSRKILEVLLKHHRNDQIYFQVSDKNPAIKKMTSVCCDPNNGILNIFIINPNQCK